VIDSLYQRIGGEPAVHATVNIFYDKFMQNSEVAFFFNDVPMAHQAKIMQKFISMILKSDRNYNHLALRKAHAPLVKKGLNDQHMDIFINTMRETLEQLDIPFEFIEEFIEIAESYRNDVLLK
jgi:hemoglobin